MRAQLVQEDHQVAFAFLHGPVPAARSWGFADLHETGQGKLADDVAGAVGRPQVGADDLQRRLALAHDPVQDGAEGAAGVQGWDDNRDRQRRVAHHAV